MRRTLLFLALFAVPVFAHGDVVPPINRHDGFVMMWEPLHRAVFDVKSKYSDVPTSDPNYKEISYAKARKILDDTDEFHPTTALRLDDALVWLFRSRNIDTP